MPSAHYLGKEFAPMVSRTKNIDQYRSVEKHSHRFRRRGFFSRRRSFSCRKPRTHAAAPFASSGWSASVQAGASLSRNRSSFFRRTASRAVSTRKALRPRGPTIASISRTRSWGNRIWARLVFISHIQCVLMECIIPVCGSHPQESPLPGTDFNLEEQRDFGIASCSLDKATD